MEDFKQYLNEDADEQERAAADQVEKGLTGLRIENMVGRVAAERKHLLRLRLLRHVFVGVVLMGIAGLGYWFYSKKEAAAVDGPGSTLPIDKALEIKDDTLKSPPQLQPPAQKPMARRPDLPKAQDEPLLRGVSPEQDSTTMALVEILLRITQNSDPVYREAHFDKQYGWGKIVLLLRQNDPAAAKREIFSAIDTSGDHAKEWQWLLGIALLEEGKPDEALEVFSRIANDPQHHRQKSAALAVEALR